MQVPTCVLRFDAAIAHLLRICGHRGRVTRGVVALVVIAVLGACAGPGPTLAGQSPDRPATSLSPSPDRPATSLSPSPDRPTSPSPSPQRPSPSPPTRARPPTSPALSAPAPAAAPAAVGLEVLAGKVVAIDPGHNGQNYAHTAEINRQVNIGNGSKECDTMGTAAKDGYTESAYNMDVATRLAAVLTGAGARVVLTRTDNNGWGPCIDQRAGIGNQAHADAALSIHADGSPTGRGFHVIEPGLVAGFNDAIIGPSALLALDIRDAYHRGTPIPYSTYAGVDGLIRRTDLGGLNLSTVPKVFIETGNMADASDIAQLESPAFRAQAALALARGLAAFLSGR